MKKTRLLLCVALIWPALVNAQRFPVTSLNIGVHLIRAEVAITDEERSRGLMFREQLGENDGMVFRFPATGKPCMWMKNTPLPLSVAFVGEDGRIVNIAEMQPHTETPHCASGPARYALEMHQGWFRKRNIRPGAAISGLPK